MNLNRTTDASTITINAKFIITVQKWHIYRFKMHMGQKINKMKYFDDETSKNDR